MNLLKRVMVVAALVFLPVIAQAQTPLVVVEGRTSGGVNKPVKVASDGTVYVTGTTGASTTADGADVTQGAIADASTTAGGAGTISGKLRLTTDLLNQILSELQLGIDITNGSQTVTEAATITANQANVALTDSVLYGFDGTTNSRIRTRAGLIGSADVGVVTRPFLASDGTNTVPAMDAVGRAGFQKLTDGTNTAVIDPCAGNAKSYQAINQTAGTQLFAGTSSKKTYICSIQLVTATAQNIALVAGTGSVCATNPVGIMGGNTAATGWNFAANGGLATGSGASSLAATTVNADNLCLLQSSSGQISGNLSYVVQ